jgi:hypothetical protein
MKYLLASPLLLVAAVPFLTPRSTDRFAITSCSLGCGGAGASVSCAIVNVHVNEEFRFGFSDEIDPSSLNSASFKLFEASTGISPAGSLRLDPLDSRVLLFTPELSFDPLGVPLFGLGWGSSYQIVIPGKGANDPGPYITSVNGLPVWTRLLCTVTSDQGVMDPVPGKPEVSPEVRVVVEHDVLGTITQAAPARGATGVALDSDISFYFHDLMNVGTIMTPLTGSSFTVVVRRAPLIGGEVIPGFFSFSFDPEALTTKVVFDPDEDLLPGETVYVDLKPLISDLIGNQLQGEIFSFVTAERTE